MKKDVKCSLFLKKIRLGLREQGIVKGRSPLTLSNRVR